MNNDRLGAGILAGILSTTVAPVYLLSAIALLGMGMCCKALSQGK